MAKKQNPPNSDEANAFEKERELMHRQMFSAVSHDLKTPLASMIGSLEIYARMKDRLSTEKKEVLIATALQEAYRLDNFVSNILDMAKLESGMVKPRHEPFEVGALIHDCLINLDNRLQGTKLRVEARSGKINITNDSSLLCRAMSLLLDNAVKYGGTPSMIDIISEIDPLTGECAIHIHDNGPGIVPSHFESVFSKYTRFAKIDHQTAGTGLGLAICRELMKTIHGSVVATNHPVDGGAVFTLRLPL